MSNPKVELHIARHGVITLELDAAKAPKVGGQLSRLRGGATTTDHLPPRHPGFMVQGGGFEPGMNQKPTDAPIEQRSQQRPQERQPPGHGRTQWPALGHGAVLHQRGRQRLPEPHRPSMQGWGYAVFGKVVAGTEVVDKIKAGEDRKGFHDDVPNGTW